MKKSELRRHKAVLEAKRDELAAAIWKRDELVTERASDEMDNLQMATERNLTISHLCLESARLRAVRDALARIKDGCYGVCLNCDGQIAARRLQLIPWAAYCVTCQEELDQRDGPGPAHEGSAELGAVA